jgi:hypothetical protein
MMKGSVLLVAGLVSLASALAGPGAGFAQGQPEQDVWRYQALDQVRQIRTRIDAGMSQADPRLAVRSAVSGFQKLVDDFGPANGKRVFVGLARRYRAVLRLFLRKSPQTEYDLLILGHLSAGYNGLLNEALKPGTDDVGAVAEKNARDREAGMLRDRLFGLDGAKYRKSYPAGSLDLQFMVFSFIAANEFPEKIARLRETKSPGADFFSCFGKVLLQETVAQALNAPEKASLADVHRTSEAFRSSCVWGPAIANSLYAFLDDVARAGEIE